MLRIAVAATVSLLTFAAVSSETAMPAPTTSRSLDGSGNNPAYPDWGSAGSQYLRVANVRYADGISALQSGPPARFISNRVFNDIGQNIFSEDDVSQWGWAWGQFIDHDVGLRDETPAEDASIPFSSADPLEAFTNDLGSMAFFRTPAAPGTGETNPRQQINTLSSFIDASNVYGVTDSRLDWLRNGASLLLPGRYLPRADARGDVDSAPPMDLMGRLQGTPARAIVAGDVRANENIALTSIHTLFAREHNRIVNKLPDALPTEAKFQIARKIVGAEIEFVTYREFLPAIGVPLDAYTGYDPAADPTLGNEFATVGYRAHSMVHGEFDVDLEAGAFTNTDLTYFRNQGIVVVVQPDGSAVLTIPLASAFGNPQLLKRAGEEAVLESLGEHEYRNDEQLDNSIRSILFKIPKPGIPDPSVCGAPAVDPDCFSAVEDLGADDIQRGRDHGMPRYNGLRRAYGLAPVASFAELTGEATELPKPANTKAMLDFVELRDASGAVIPLGTDAARETAVSGTRRTTLAARLRSVYGTVDKVDAFVGMVSEPHVAGSELGPLQLAIWKTQFQALRDGDRFFYRTDPVLDSIRTTYGITFRHTLAELIALNTDFTPPADVFHAA